jgi:hypothetical protein
MWSARQNIQLGWLFKVTIMDLVSVFPDMVVIELFNTPVNIFINIDHHLPPPIFRFLKSRYQYLIPMHGIEFTEIYMQYFSLTWNW